MTHLLLHIMEVHLEGRIDIGDLPPVSRIERENHIAVISTSRMDRPHDRQVTADIRLHIIICSTGIYNNYRK